MIESIFLLGIADGALYSLIYIISFMIHDILEKEIK